MRHATTAELSDEYAERVPERMRRAVAAAYAVDVARIQAEARVRGEERRKLIAGLYLDGLPIRKIGERIGMSESSTLRLLWRMRQDGWDLPHRRPRGERAGT